MIYNFSSVVGGGGLTQLKHFVKEARFEENDLIVITKVQTQMLEGVNCKKIVLSDRRMLKFIQLLCFKWLWRSKEYS